MSEPKSKNLTWHEGQISRQDRELRLGQRGCTIWLTGLSGSGKSTLAVAAETLLAERGHHTYILDGDNIRQGLNENLGFSPEDRTENIRRIGEVAKLFTDAGSLVFSAFISPYRSDREAVREIMADVRARQLTRRSSGAEQIYIVKLSVLRRKIVHMPKRKPIDLDGSTGLNIIF